MNGLNVMLEPGKEIQTDKIWIDPSDTTKKYRVYQKVVDCGALPNATGKNVAHGITALAPTKHMRISLWATNGSTKGRGNGGDPLIEVDATNIVITATANLSAYTASVVLLEFCKTTDLV